MPTCSTDKFNVTGMRETYMYVKWMQVYFSKARRGRFHWLRATPICYLRTQTTTILLQMQVRCAYLHWVHVFWSAGKKELYSFNIFVSAQSGANGVEVYFFLVPVSNSLSGAGQTLSTLQQTPSQGQDCSSIRKSRGEKQVSKDMCNVFDKKTRKGCYFTHFLYYSVKSIFLAFAHIYY